ncbi:MAG: HAD hydrolase-like protein, partial [Pseudomonadales bacterium]
MSACLLFDFDGTLVDSERLCHVGLVRKFQPLGIDLDADELMMRFKGWKLGRILEILESEHDLLLPADFVPTYRAIVSELFDAELKPIEGIEQALI